MKANLQTMNHLHTKKYFLMKHLFLSLAVLALVLTITGCEQPFSKAEVSGNLSSNDAEGSGVRLEYGSGTVCSVDFVRSLVFVQPEAELPGLRPHLLRSSWNVNIWILQPLSHMTMSCSITTKKIFLQTKSK